ncbi:hypothetical protein EDM53_05700 [Rickettsiales endosymbiont of Peranema trichophorum]|uniref:hypothetical protein n=1 Tax=Rickettsiales endosymbiont of Peranema trichophorum TaxID=2486577 RepID=UPI001023A2A1|nr:hypothetical protein [Rickettsiales endosymbiont of Peranema trichophorum]RZI45158.1 hypothetical protein EDM53_05700 [Rickettsiales endosymbiont of Peranema trichophorum]
MKKISLILLSLVSACVALVWLLLANRFEKLVMEELVVDLQKGRASRIVKTDLSSFKVQKYLFRFSLGDTILFEDLGVGKIHVEGIQASYNPFTNMITMKTTGEKSIISFGTVDTYIEKPSVVVQFDGAILSQRLSDFPDTQVAVKIEQPYSLRFVSDNSEIYKANGSSMTFIGKKAKNGAYKVTYQAGVKGVTWEWLNHALNSSTFGTDKIAGLIFDVIGEWNLDVSIVMDLPKSLLEMIKNLRSSRPNMRDISKIGRDEKWLLDMSYHTHAGPYASKFKWGIASDGEHNISLEFMGDSRANYTQGQKESIRDRLSNALLKEWSINENIPSVLRSSVTGEDLRQLMDVALDIRTFISETKGSCNRCDSVDGELHFSDLLRLNDHTIHTNIDYNKDGSRELVAAVKVSDPHAMIASVVSTLEANYPLIEKLYKLDQRQGKFAFLKRTVENVKADAYDALAALDKDGELKPGEDLVLNINPRFKDNVVDINGKTLLETMQDPRIRKFLDGFEKQTKEESVEPKVK